jgi:hypothetical protein
MGIPDFPFCFGYKSTLFLRYSVAARLEFPAAFPGRAAGFV